MQIEPVRSVATDAPSPRPAGEPGPESGPDRDEVTLEGLEGELAVLEDELARVEADRAGGSGGPGGPAGAPR
jgi:hypothetical protein